ncbi:MAG TPA: DUF192 domain-containing protein [Dehalococcoidia bacterium]|nr:DUF192 domain-containing protein [Dehalococcoidia bacterium]
MQVLNQSKGSILASNVQLAESWWSRLRGLLGRGSLNEGQALFLKPSSSIHTFFMRFSIDAVFVDKENRVVKVVADLKPFRVALGKGAHAVLELRAGAVTAMTVEPGDILLISNGGE